VRYNSDGAERYRTAVIASMEDGLDAVCQAIATDAKNSMQGRGSRHVASPPGTPPHVQTGFLWKSITSNRTGPLRRLVGSFLAKAGYPKLHEFGGTVSRVSSRGKPYTATYPARPWLRPAFTRQRSRVGRIFTEYTAKALRRRIGGGA